MDSFSQRKLPICFLFDNGSLRPAATLSLRRTASELAAILGTEVRAVSLLHSSAIDPAQLGGQPAQLLEPALNEYLESHPTAEIVLLPLFFGPSGALTEYVPERVASISKKFPESRLRLAQWLVDCDRPDTRIAEALGASVHRVIAERGLWQPRVVLVDHGSPQKAVTAVRDHLGAQLAQLLADSVFGVAVASMEKRPGPEYAFNDPLLAERLRKPPFDRGDVIVALQFLSPGRHAGPEGDVAKICAAARADQLLLRTHLTGTIASDARVIAVAADRYREALETFTPAAQALPENEPSR
ncbi:MAG: cobalamin biosynthesis protein CbiX [Nibricoccus sp.]